MKTTTSELLHTLCKAERDCLKSAELNYVKLKNHFILN